MKKVGCTPIYWRAFLSQDKVMEECSTSSKLAAIYHHIKHFKDVLNGYKPPCDDMKIITSIQRQPYGWSNEYFFLEFLYMDENYQEIVNHRDFTLASFTSQTGGFVGMFLGFSLLQVSDAVERLWEWYQHRKERLNSSSNPRN